MQSKILDFWSAAADAAFGFFVFLRGGHVFIGCSGEFRTSLSAIVMQRYLLLYFILVFISILSCSAAGIEFVNTALSPSTEDTEFVVMETNQDSLVADATAKLMKLSVRELKQKLLRHKLDPRYGYYHPIPSR
jgi:multidrug efflux pump subunit AcrB